VVVVDGVVPGSRAAMETVVLARAARSTRCFSLLTVGSAALAPDLAGSGPEINVITVPALIPAQVLAYLASWLDATLLPDAPPLIVTIDAALLVAHRSEGNLARINALVGTMLATPGAVLTSWHAWAATEPAGDQAADPLVLPVRPASWPPPEILRLINLYRAAAGLPDRGPAE
jgi:hypothetical protein